MGAGPDLAPPDGIRRPLRPQCGSSHGAITAGSDYARVPKEVAGIYPRRSVT